MTITRETLELAARAAGIEKDDSPYNGGGLGNDGFDSTGSLVTDWHNSKRWNPLTNHSQLLDLAMACKINICPMIDNIVYEVEGKFAPVSIHVNCQDFPALAEAVIQAAAEQQLAKEGK